VVEANISLTNKPNVRRTENYFAYNYIFRENKLCDLSQYNHLYVNAWVLAYDASPHENFHIGTQ
jgi:hypothetical protein